VTEGRGVTERDRVSGRERRWARGVPAIGLLAVTVVGAVAAEAYTFHGLVSEAPPRAADFSLTAHTGKRVSLRDFGRTLRLLYFGYTHCPGICPTTLAEANQALRLLPPRQSARVRLLLISVDPARDTPERLAAYLAHFNPSFVGLTGTAEEIAKVAAAYGIYYRVVEGASPTEYVVDHTSMIIVVDERGVVRLLFPYGTTAKDIAEDLRHLLR
jgi:protein SCO1